MRGELPKSLNYERLRVESITAVTTEQENFLAVFAIANSWFSTSQTANMFIKRHVKIFYLYWIGVLEAFSLLHEPPNQPEGSNEIIIHANHAESNVGNYTESTLANYTEPNVDNYEFNA
jgi:hypothetical protein